MPDRFHFTDSGETNALIARDPMALLVGFAPEQQVTVHKGEWSRRPGSSS